MNRDLLSSVISRVNIRGLADHAILQFKQRDLWCSFVSGDQIVSGTIIYEKFNNGDNFVGDGKIGIPNLQDFVKKLDTLGAEIDVSIVTESRYYKVMVLSDGVWTIKHNLIVDSQMPPIRKIKTSSLSLAPVVLPVDTEFIKRFYKMTGAAKDCKYMYVVSGGTDVEMYIAQSDEFLTGVKLQYGLAEPGESFERLKFDLKSIRNILNANKDMSGNLIFHTAGILHIEFISDHMVCNYYLTAEI